MNELIKIEPRQFGGGTVQTVNARDLHAFLGVKSEFRNWIKNRIDDFGFVEGVDYVTLVEIYRGGERKDYHLTTDMAKELSMVERNEKGKQARQYFIDCERRAAQVPAGPALPDFTDPAAAAIAWAEQFKAKQALALQNAAQAEQLAIAAPKAAALDRMAQSTDGAICLRVAAKLAQVPEKQYINFLHGEGWIYRHPHGSTWMGYTDKEQAGLIELKKTHVTRDDGSDKTVVQVLITPKGQARAAELIERKAPWLRKVATSAPPRPGVH